jgi:curved DNA-binding protein CbpA
MPAPPDDGIELPPERRRRIDELYPLLDQLDHYQLLGLERSADAKQIRASYYELSKLFHPDTAFRKNLGPYKAKMEAIFKRLTEAYEVLGKKKSRAEYDAYLALRGITSEAERAIAAPEREPLAPPAQAAATATARPPAAPEPVRPSAASPEAEGAAPSSGPVRSPGLPAGASAAPEPCMPSGDGRTMSEEAKKKFRELWAKRFAALRGPPNRTPPMPPRSPEDIGRDLVHSLKRSSEVTKGAALDLVDPLVPDATRSELAGDLAAAVRHMRLAVALAPDRADLHADSARLSRRLAEQLAPRYRQQAEYEERHKKWKAAAASWLKVVEGYPDDPEVLCRAAVALVEARGDLHHAHRLAQRACELRPDDAVAHEVLGRVCLAAGLSLNARRALERAAMLDPHNEIVKNLLSALKT